MRSRRLVSLVLVCGLLVFCGQPVQAANKQSGLQISPLRSRPVQNPGNTSTGQIKVANHSKSPLDITLSVERFSVINEDYAYDFKAGAHTDWVRLADTKIHLATEETKNIAYSLAIPVDASPGGYYFVIFASSQTSTDPTAFNQIERVGSLIYLEVNGLIVRKVSLLGIDAAWLQTGSQVSVDSRLSNQGNSHYDARLKQGIKPIVGIGSSSGQPQALILPSTVRRVQNTLRMPRLPGIYRLTTTFAPPQGGEEVSSQIIVNLPTWFDGLVLIFVAFILFKRTKHRTKPSDDTQSV